MDFWSYTLLPNFILSPILMNRKFWLLLKRKTIIERSNLNFYFWMYKPLSNLSQLFRYECILLLELRLLHKQSFQVHFTRLMEEKGNSCKLYFNTRGSAPYDLYSIKSWFICLAITLISIISLIIRTYFNFYSLTSKEELKLKLKSETNSEIVKWETGEHTNRKILLFFFLLELVVWSNKTSDLFTWM